jgi:hypothetical protein
MIETRVNMYQKYIYYVAVKAADCQAELPSLIAKRPSPPPIRLALVENSGSHFTWIN